MMLSLIIPLPAFASYASADDSAPFPKIAFPVAVRVTGEIPSPHETYTVLLTSVEHAPMPGIDEDNSGPEHLEFAVDGPGEVLLPSISFRTAGVYHYSISQVEGDYPSAHYDTSKYSVAVTVSASAEGSDLKVTVSIMKDGKKQDGAIFLNDYGSLGGDDNPAPDIPAPPPIEDSVDGPEDEPPTEPDNPHSVNPSTPHTNRPNYPPPVHYYDLPLNKLIQTGQLNWPVWLFGCAGFVLVSLGVSIIVMNRKRSEKQKGREKND